MGWGVAQCVQIHKRQKAKLNQTASTRTLLESTLTSSAANFNTAVNGVLSGTLRLQQRNTSLKTLSVFHCKGRKLVFSGWSQTQGALFASAFQMPVCQGWGGYQQGQSLPAPQFTLLPLIQTSRKQKQNKSKQTKENEKHWLCPKARHLPSRENKKLAFLSKRLYLPSHTMSRHQLLS